MSSRRLACQLASRASLELHKDLDEHTAAPIEGKPRFPAVERLKLTPQSASASCNVDDAQRGDSKFVSFTD